MKPYAIVKFEAEGRPFTALLMPTGWQIQGYPDSLLPAILDRRTSHLSTIYGSYVMKAARIAARTLGGKYKVLRQLPVTGEIQ